MRRQACLTSVALVACATLAVNVTGQQRDQEAQTVSGRTVWDGVYTGEQAGRGRTEYERACAACHAEDLRGNGTAPSLVDESFWFLYGDTTVGELFDRIRTLMPSDRPNSLSSQSYRDIVAFILQSNKLPPGEKELDADPEALRRILITMKRPEPAPQSASVPNAQPADRFVPVNDLRIHYLDWAGPLSDRGKCQGSPRDRRPILSGQCRGPETCLNHEDYENAPRPPGTL